MPEKSEWLFCKSEFPSLHYLCQPSNFPSIAYQLCCPSEPDIRYISTELPLGMYLRGSFIILHDPLRVDSPYLDPQLDYKTDDKEKYRHCSGGTFTPVNKVLYSSTFVQTCNKFHKSLCTSFDTKSIFYKSRTSFIYQSELYPFSILSFIILIFLFG